jgi:hypothetical protein
MFDRLTGEPSRAQHRTGRARGPLAQTHDVGHAVLAVGIGTHHVVSPVRRRDVPEAGLERAALPAVAWMADDGAAQTLCRVEHLPVRGTASVVHSDDPSLGHRAAQRADQRDEVLVRLVGRNEDDHGLAGQVEDVGSAAFFASAERVVTTAPSWIVAASQRDEELMRRSSVAAAGVLDESVSAAVQAPRPPATRTRLRQTQTTRMLSLRMRYFERANLWVACRSPPRRAARQRGPRAAATSASRVHNGRARRGLSRPPSRVRHRATPTRRWGRGR